MHTVGQRTHSQTAGVVFGLIALLCVARASGDTISVVTKLSTTGSGLYLANRAPLKPVPLLKLPTGVILRVKITHP